MTSSKMQWASAGVQLIESRLTFGTQGAADAWSKSKQGQGCTLYAQLGCLYTLWKADDGTNQ